MYRAIKRKFGGRTPAVIIAVICAAYLLCCSAIGYAATTPDLVHVDGTVNVEATEAVFSQLQYVGEDSTISANGNIVTINVTGMYCPGANAIARITAENTGTLSATLTDISLDSGNIDYIKISVASVPIGEVLLPGETCTFEIMVYWDPERTDITESQAATSFEVIFTYENNEYIEIPSEGTPDDNDDDSTTLPEGTTGTTSGIGDLVVPDTGDSVFYGVVFGLGAVCAVVMIICLFLIFFKKKKEDDDDQK